MFLYDGDDDVGGCDEEDDDDSVCVIVLKMCSAFKIYALACNVMIQ